MNFFLIIPASGIGKRFKSKEPKQFFNIGEENILSLTIKKFHQIKEIKNIFISTLPAYIEKLCLECGEKNFYKVKHITAGGETRQESVYNSLSLIKAKKTDKIIIHDAVRPFVSAHLIKSLMKESLKTKNVIPGIRISDTVKRTNNKNIITETLNRENLWSVQTPQFFQYYELINAFDIAIKNNFQGTDEASIMEYAGYKVAISEGEKSNIKITTGKDLDFKK